MVIECLQAELAFLLLFLWVRYVKMNGNMYPVLNQTNYCRLRYFELETNLKLKFDCTQYVHIYFISGFILLYPKHSNGRQLSLSHLILFEILTLFCLRYLSIPK